MPWTSIDTISLPTVLDYTHWNSQLKGNLDFLNSLRPTPATTLPAAPTDGQQALLVDSTSAPTYSWLMQWSAAASLWIATGVVPLSSYDGGGGNINSAAAITVGTPPSITIAHAGSYLIRFMVRHAYASSSSGVGTSVSTQLTKNGAALTTVTTTAMTPTSPFAINQYAPSEIRVTLAATDVLSMKHLVDNTALTGNVSQRVIAVTPYTLTS
jgi:hypothetical protein